MSQLKQRANLLSSAFFILLRPSRDGMMPLHTGEGDLLFTQSTDLNAHIFQKPLWTYPEITFYQLSQHLLAQ